LPVSKTVNPFQLVAAVGDPMQIVAAGMAITASRSKGVILAGGTQMLAVYALIRAIADYFVIPVELKQIVVGTTRWVAEDPTGDTIRLAQLIGGVPLLATGLNFATSRYPGLRAYEQGYVKEGVGAGGCAIAAHLRQSWTPSQLLAIIETLYERYRYLRLNPTS
jgi:NaMN:DMB phosphoribosyltransferase